MPPKGKEKPKSKKELKAEQEAAAAAAEQERLRQEEEARRIAEQLELRRQELLYEFEQSRNYRLVQECKELEPVFSRLQQQRSQNQADQAAAAEWDRYLSCTPLPDPHDRPAMNDFINSLFEDPDTKLDSTMERCVACIDLANQCLLLAQKEVMTSALAAAVSTLTAGPAGSSSTDSKADSSSSTGGNSRGGSESSSNELKDQPASDAAVAEQATAPGGGGDDSSTSCEAALARAAQYQQDATELFEHIGRMMDAATAHILHRSDEHADEKGSVLLTAQQDQLQWGLWVNAHKNPRFKLLEFPGLGMTVEIPKQLALANIALRVQRRPYNAYPSTSGRTDAAASASCLAPLGFVFQVEQLALPPPAKRSGGWTVRQVSPQSGLISVVPYPIPPVGADLSTWQPDEEPPPLTFNLVLPQHLVPAAVRVGWWDSRQGAWSEAGISGVSYDPASGRLSFSSTHLGYLSVLQDTSALLPYTAWTVRPSGGMGGSTAIIDLQVAVPPSQNTVSRDGGSSGSSSSRLSLEVGSGWVTLRSPALPQLHHLVGKRLPPWELLAACEACGLRLTPGAREAAASGLAEKEPAAEQAMCADLALLCTRFLVASSRWNRADEARAVLVRLSEVLDWEEGGRTSAAATARIFSKEATQGKRQVLIARREAPFGIVWVDGGNNRSEPPQPPDLSSIEKVQAAAQNEAGWLRGSLTHLLAERQQQAGTQESGDAQSPPQLTVAELAGAVDASFVGSMTCILLALRLLSFA